MDESEMNECQALCELVDKVSERVKDRLISKYYEGKRGWDDPSRFDVGDLITAIMDETQEKDPIDVIAYAMFWWNRVREVGNEQG